MEHITGALAGWERTRARHGIILSLQVATAAGDLRQDRLSRVDVALNERQLRSFARDLVRAAKDRDIELFAREPRWLGADPAGWLRRKWRHLRYHR